MTLLCGRKKNDTIRVLNIFVNFCSNKKIFQVKIRKDHKFFFPHINKVIRPFLEKISSKIHFFTFLKSGQKCTLTPIFVIFQKWLYEYSCFFGFQVKYSIAIFSAIQNVIWSRIDDFRTF